MISLELCLHCLECFRDIVEVLVDNSHTGGIVLGNGLLSFDDSSLLVVELLGQSGEGSLVGSDLGSLDFSLVFCLASCLKSGDLLTKSSDTCVELVLVLVGAVQSVAVLDGLLYGSGVGHGLGVSLSSLDGVSDRCLIGVEVGGSLLDSSVHSTQGIVSGHELVVSGELLVELRDTRAQVLNLRCVLTGLSNDSGERSVGSLIILRVGRLLGSVVSVGSTLEFIKQRLDLLIDGRSLVGSLLGVVLVGLSAVVRLNE